MTTLGAGVDAAINRIVSTYEVRGMKTKLADYQSHNGAVAIATTPKVQYGYADGSMNTVRPTSLTYPMAESSPTITTRLVA